MNFKVKNQYLLSSKISLSTRIFSIKLKVNEVFGAYRILSSSPPGK